MPRIFISYRRDDSTGHAGRIHERLASVFGSSSVFMDLDDIQPGTNFIGAIENSVQASDFVVVLIGKQWLNLTDATGRRRIDDERDFVHAEIAQALERNIPIIPVLLSNIVMPSEKDLPPRLKPLARFQAMSLSDERWDFDINRLVTILEKGEKPGSRRQFIRIAVIVLALVAAAIVALVLAGSRAPDVSGRWSSTVTYDFGDTYSEEFLFKQDGGSLTGTVSFLDARRGIIDGKVEGNRIHFKTRTEEQQSEEIRPVTHEYQGTIDNDEIRFAMRTEGGFSVHQPIEFVAKRTP
jgi:hypothetical protein